MASQSVPRPSTEYESKSDQHLKGMLSERGLSKKGGRQNWIPRLKEHDGIVEQHTNLVRAASEPPPVTVPGGPRRLVNTPARRWAFWLPLVIASFLLLDYALGRAVGQAVRRMWLAGEHGITFARCRMKVRVLLGLFLLVLWWRFTHSDTLCGNRSLEIEGDTTSQMSTHDGLDRSEHADGGTLMPPYPVADQDRERCAQKAPQGQPQHVSEATSEVQSRPPASRETEGGLTEQSDVSGQPAGEVKQRLLSLKSAQGLPSQRPFEYSDKDKPNPEASCVSSESAQETKQESLATLAAPARFFHRECREKTRTVELKLSTLRSMCKEFSEDVDPQLQTADFIINRLQSKCMSSTTESQAACWIGLLKLQDFVMSVSTDVERQCVKRKHALEERYGTLQKQYGELKSINAQMAGRYFISTRSVSVMLRIRGKDDKDKDSASSTIEIDPKEPNKLQMIATDDCYRTSTKKETKSFEFEHVFDPTVSNRMVFEKLEPLVQAMLTGYCMYIIMDGQSGAGKTFTMFNGPDAIAPSVADQIFSRFDTIRVEGRECRVTCSAIQIHLGILKDLFADGSRLGADGPYLKQEHKQEHKLFKIQGCKVEEAASSHALQRLLDMALAKRQTSATTKNAGSSRSHLVCTITVHQALSTAIAASESQLVLVDLAGSERIPTDPTTGTGSIPQSQLKANDPKMLQKETKFINEERYYFKSALRALVKGEKPDTGNNLTKVLSGCFQKRSRVVWIANVSPLKEDHSATSIILTDALTVARVDPIDNGATISRPLTPQRAQKRLNSSHLWGATPKRLYQTLLRQKALAEIRGRFTSPLRLNQEAF